MKQNLDHQEILGDFLIRNQESEGFGKRYYLWENSLEFIQKKPIFGNGISPTIGKAINELEFKSAVVSHNSILDVFLWTGVVNYILQMHKF